MTIVARRSATNSMPYHTETTALARPCHLNIFQPSLSSGSVRRVFSWWTSERRSKKRFTDHSKYTLKMWDPSWSVWKTCNEREWMAECLRDWSHYRPIHDQLRPTSFRRVAQKANMSFLWIKLKFNRIKCYKVFLCEKFQRQSCSRTIPLSKGV